MIYFSESELQKHEERIINRALAEKDREIATLKHDYAQLKEAYDAKVAGIPLGPIIGAQTIINQQISLAEKDREIAHLQDVYTKQRHKQEDAYRQLMDQAVRFAENVVRNGRWQEHEWNEAVKFLQSPEVKAWKEQT